MPKILTNINKVGNFLKKEQWREENWCRKDVAVTVAPGSKMEVGTVLYSPDGGTTPYIPVDASYDPDLTTATTTVILVDERVEDETLFQIDAQGQYAWAAGGTFELAVLYRGDAIVRAGGLIYADDTKAATAQAELEALDIRFAESLKGKYHARPLARV